MPAGDRRDGLMGRQAPKLLTKLVARLDAKTTPTARRPDVDDDEDKPDAAGPAAAVLFRWKHMACKGCVEGRAHKMSCPLCDAQEALEDGHGPAGCHNALLHVFGGFVPHWQGKAEIEATCGKRDYLLVRDRRDLEATTHRVEAAPLRATAHRRRARRLARFKKHAGCAVLFATRPPSA